MIPTKYICLRRTLPGRTRTYIVRPASRATELMPFITDPKKDKLFYVSPAATCPDVLYRAASALLVQEVEQAHSAQEWIK